jgi:hypothetical protein
MYDTNNINKKVNFISSRWQYKKMLEDDNNSKV